MLAAAEVWFKYFSVIIVKFYMRHLTYLIFQFLGGDKTVDRILSRTSRFLPNKRFRLGGRLNIQKQTAFTCGISL